MKRQAGVLLLIAAVCFAGEYGGGSGSITDPYLIADEFDLLELSMTSGDWSSRFRVVDDIDASVLGISSFEPIGNGSTRFMGVFDGDGHTIYNFSYTASVGTAYAGLFGFVEGSGVLIRDLNLVNCDVNGVGGLYVGAVAGYLLAGRIENCRVYDGTILGGQIGTGGVVGLSGVVVTGCFADCSVSGGNNVGGVVGYNAGGGNVRFCCAVGDVDGDKNVGGLVGLNVGGIIEQSSARGSVSAADQDGGGLVGRNDGGLVRRSYSAALVGGGVIDIGGLIGLSSGVTESSFWDVESSGQLNSAGGVGLLTEQMQSAETFISAGWDFVDVWEICEGMNYPALRIFVLAGDIVCPAGIGLEDYAGIAKWWLEDGCMGRGYCGGADIDSSGKVGWGDMAFVVEGWLGSRQ